MQSNAFAQRLKDLQRRLRQAERSGSDGANGSKDSDDAEGGDGAADGVIAVTADAVAALQRHIARRRGRVVSAFEAYKRSTGGAECSFESRIPRLRQEAQRRRRSRAGPAPRLSPTPGTHAPLRFAETKAAEAEAAAPSPCASDALTASPVHFTFDSASDGAPNSRGVRLCTARSALRQRIEAMVRGCRGCFLHR